MEDKQRDILTVSEIVTLSVHLKPQNQAYVLNTINALLYSQQCESIVRTDQPQQTA